MSYGEITATARSEGPAAWFESLLTDPDKDRIATWWRSDPDAPLVLKSALRPDRAQLLLNDLRNTGVWAREYYVKCADRHGTEEVSREEYVVTPQPRQFSDNSCLRPTDDDKTLPNVRRFLAALEDGVVSSFLEDIIEAPLDPRPAAEWARYTPGDFLRQHSDQVDGRRVGMVLYLNDDPWTEECGGHFAYENQFGRVIAVPPIFNSMALFPFRPDCGHWVSSVKGWTRYSVAIHYLDDGSRGRLRSTGRYGDATASRSGSPQAV